MKYTIIIWLLLLLASKAFSLEPANPSFQCNLSGTITDRQTGEKLPGVSIYFPDLETGTVSKSDGSYSITGLPCARLLVKVNSTGYQMMALTVDLQTINHMDFTLEPAVTEISEIVVTGQSNGTEKTRAPAPIAIIPPAQLLENSATNMIDALASQPGIAQITSGAGISKPVIRGLGYNRMVVVNDGIRQEGQQWGDEHGIEVDEASVYKVEVLKGPASLAYGSDAMAGVINLLSAPLLPVNTRHGEWLSNFQTNNGLFANSLSLSGNQKGMVWNFRVSDKRAHAYTNPYDGPVYNSGFNENAQGAIVGINRSWGFVHLHLSRYELKPGIVEGDRDSSSGQFIKADGSLARNFKNTYSVQVPFQQVEHYKALIDNSIYLGQGNIKTSIGFQQNQRKEFADPIFPQDYQLYFLLNTVNYNLQYAFPEYHQVSLLTGVNGMWQQSQNKGKEFLIPAYSLFDAGLYFIVKKTSGAFDVAGGLRVDQRFEQAHALYLDETDQVTDPSTNGAKEKFTAFDQTFTGVSASAGVSWQINRSIYAKVNGARGFRAPNISELGSNGVHEGTLRYEKGNPLLKPETSFQLDLTAGWNTKHVAGELNLFSNTVNHFIYSRKQTDSNGNSLLIDNLPVFVFTSGKANLKGGEFTLDIHPHPHDWIHIENSISYVDATLTDQPDSMRYLPLTPPFHWSLNIQTKLGTVMGHLKNSYLKAGVDWYAPQNHYFGAYQTETATPGYWLLNAGAGSDISWQNKIRCSLYISAANLTDVAYQSHLSRLKYAPQNNATGRAGVFNMGRNISFKLLIPVNL